MTVFWTADLHIGHSNIQSYEPARWALGPTVDAMNEALIDRWNAVVQPDDQVYINGDLCMGKIAETLPLVERLHGEKFLMLGNHDRPFGLMAHAGEDSKKGRMWARWSTTYEEVGLTLLTDEWADMWFGEHIVRVCHFPPRGDHTGEDRYVENRPPEPDDPAHSGIFVHGHVHGAWKVRENMINVGVDVWDYAPVAEAEIVQLIATLT